MNQKEKVLVLGGAGFIGSALVHELLKEGYAVRVFARSSLSLQRLKDVVEHCEWVYGDFLDDHALRKATEGVDIVYHLITTTFPAHTVESSAYDVTSNLLPTIRLMESCLAHGVKSLIYASSGGTVYGEPEYLPIDENHPRNPVSLYGLSKLSVENYLMFHSRLGRIKVHLLRLSNAYGPGQNPYGIQGLIGVTIKNLLEELPLKIYGDGSTVRDYLYIDDIVSALKFVTKLEESSVMNVSSGQGTSVNEVLDCIEAVGARKMRRIYLPKRVGDVETNILDNKLISSKCGWQPCMPLNEGISLTLNWYLKYFLQPPIKTSQNH